MGAHGHLPHLILSGQTTEVLWFDLLCLSQPKINTLRKWLFSAGVTCSVFMGLSLFNLVIYLSTKRIYSLFQTCLALQCPLTVCPHQLCFHLMCLQWVEWKLPCFDVPVQFQIITSFRLCCQKKEQQDFKMREPLDSFEWPLAQDWKSCIYQS